MLSEIQKVKAALVAYIQAGHVVQFSTTCADGHWFVKAQTGQDGPDIFVEGYAEENYGPVPEFSDLRVCDILMLAASVVDPKSGY